MTRIKLLSLKEFNSLTPLQARREQKATAFRAIFLEDLSRGVLITNAAQEPVLRRNRPRAEQRSTYLVELDIQDPAFIIAQVLKASLSSPVRTPDALSNPHDAAIINATLRILNADISGFADLFGPAKRYHYVKPCVWGDELAGSIFNDIPTKTLVRIAMCSLAFTPEDFPGFVPAIYRELESSSSPDGVSAQPMTRTNEGVGSTHGWEHRKS